MTGHDHAQLARRLRASPLLRRLAREAGGATLYLTGGALRDRLLGVSTHDLDLVVEGDAKSLASRLGATLGGRPVPLGTHPEITWRVAGRRWQVDLLEIPRGGLGRDMTRRDFTVNAMFWRLPGGPLLDLTGGLDDLAAGRLVVVDPRNLRDDPLRVLRGLRLVATRPALSLTAQSERHLSDAREGLKTVASERVTAELRLLLTGPAAHRALRIAWRSGVIATLHPSWQSVGQSDEVFELAGRLAALAGHGSALRAGAHTASLAVLAAPAAGFPHTWSEAAAAEVLAAVGFARRTAWQAARAAGLGQLLAPLLAAGDPECRALAAEHPHLLPAALAWAVASRGGGADGACALLRWMRGFVRRPPLLRGDEVATLLSLPPGQRLAAAVHALRRAHARGDVRTRAQAKRWLRQRVDPTAHALLL